PVDAVEGRTNVKRACAERVVGTTSHLDRQTRLALAHFGGRCPGRPFSLAGNLVCSGPLEALAADTDGVARGLAIAVHVIERTFLRFDDDAAHRLVGLVAHFAARVAGMSLA